MTREEAIQHLENMKWLKGYDNTTVDGVPLDNVIDDIIDLIKGSFTPQEVYDTVIEPAVDILNMELMCKAGDM